MTQSSPEAPAVSSSIEPFEPENCGNCRFIRVADPTQLGPKAPRHCVRFPPVCAPLIQQQRTPNGQVGTRIDTWTSFPVVFLNSPACGEWQIKPGMAQ